MEQESQEGPGPLGQVGGMLSTGLVSVRSLPPELLTLVSQKMCVVVYPEAERGSGTEKANEDMEEQQQPMYQPTPTKDKDVAGQAQP